MSRSEMSDTLLEIAELEAQYISPELARKVVLSCETEDVVNVLETLLKCENNYFTRYILPWLPGKKTTSHLIDILETFNPDYCPHISNIIYCLLDSGIEGLEIEFTAVLKKLISFQDEELTEKVLPVCARFITEDLGDFLIENYDDELSGIVEAIIFNTSIEKVQQRIQSLSELGHEPIIRNPIFKSLLLQNPDQDLSDIFSMLLESDLLAYPSISWGNGNGSSIFMLLLQYGSSQHVNILDLIPDEVSLENGGLIQNLRVVLKSRHDSELSNSFIPLETFEGWEKFAIKDNRGFSETRLRGFYMGLKHGPQPFNTRQNILNEILNSTLCPIHSSRLRPDFPQGTGRWATAYHATFDLLGDGKYSDFRKRISTASKFIREKPHSPWGYYAYEILNMDRWEILSKVGLSIGLIPFIECSPHGVGLMECKIMALKNVNQGSDMPKCCDAFYPRLTEEEMTCSNCHTSISNFSESWDEAKHRLGCDESEVSSAVNLKLEGDDSEFIITNSSGKETKLTQRGYQKLRAQLREFMPYLPKPSWDHLAAMHADIEEMAGISGDPIKRWGLD